MLFYFCVVGLLGGLALGIYLKISLVLLLFLLIIMLGIFHISQNKDFYLYKYIALFVFVFSSAFTYGILYEYLHQPQRSMLEKVNKKVSLKGVVYDEPVPKEKSTQIRVKTEHGNVLLFADSFPKLQYGDEIIFSGKLKRPQSFATETGRMFDYPGYLSKDNIFFTISYPKIEKVGEKKGNFFKSNLFELKNSIVGNMEKVVPYPESTLLQGITLAGKKALPSGIEDQFRRAGVSHIVVLSGYNVTIVALIIMKLLSRLPRNVAFTFSSAGILAFCILAGGSSTIIRAGLMSFLFLLSKFIRRDADGNRLLLIAGCVMAAFNPRILLYDVSFHLSFLATFSLINISQHV
jgi:competence protein ComEC